MQVYWLKHSSFSGNYYFFMAIFILTFTVNSVSYHQCLGFLLIYSNFLFMKEIC